jgi:hypothetical protein
MSGGSWTYNRFDSYEQTLAEKKATKDYDGDGKVESSKDEYFGSKDKAIKKAMGKDTKKKSKDDDCECNEETMSENRAMANGGHPLVGDGSKPKGPTNPKNKTQTMMGKDGKPLFKESSCDGYQEGGEVKAKKKKVVKEDVLDYMIENSFASNEVSAEVLFNHISDEFLESIEEDIMEIYQGKHGQSEKQYQDGRSPAGKMISGDSKGSGANYSYRAKNTGANPAGGSQKPQGQARMNSKDRAFLAHQKAR